MKVKFKKRPAVEKKETEKVSEPIIRFEELPPCPWAVKMTAYGPVDGQPKLLSDPRGWLEKPVEGWVALFTVFGTNWNDCMKSFKLTEASRMENGNVDE